MSKKVAVMLGEGFEPIEAIAPVDCMRRAGIEVELVSVMPSVQVKSAQGIVVEAEALDENMDLSTFDAIVIPGGGLGVDNLKKSDKLSKALVESMAIGRLRSVQAPLCSTSWGFWKAGRLRVIRGAKRAFRKVSI